MQAKLDLTPAYPATSEQASTIGWLQAPLARRHTNGSPALSSTVSPMIRARLSASIDGGGWARMLSGAELRAKDRVFSQHFTANVLAGGLYWSNTPRLDASTPQADSSVRA